LNPVVKKWTKEWSHEEYLVGYMSLYELDEKNFDIVHKLMGRTSNAISCKTK